MPGTAVTKSVVANEPGGRKREEIFVDIIEKISVTFSSSVSISCLHFVQLYDYFLSLVFLSMSCYASGAYSDIEINQRQDGPIKSVSNQCHNIGAVDRLTRWISLDQSCLVFF